MTSSELNNLVQINQLKVEPPNQAEFDGMVSAARTKLKDVRIEGLSIDSQFSLAYSAAHSLSVAALRWHGYRSENRYLVFQCLTHTLKLPSSKCRVLDTCHKRRNLAEYEGQLTIDQRLLKELIDIADELLLLVSSLEPIPKSHT